MHRSATLLALGALSSTATAAWLNSNQERSWEPPRQTGVFGEEAELGQVAMGWSPVPTGAPKLAGAMDMGFALGKRAVTDNTCGYDTVGSESIPERASSRSRRHSPGQTRPRARFPSVLN
jgi:hypothetical protein